MKHRCIFLLTGAGISAESGLGTFRDKEGLWANFRIEDVASIGGYERDPQRVLDFYNLRRANLTNAKPNPAHEALARLEKAWSAHDGNVTICTQNVDDLHEQAGSRNVIHMHGELRKYRCGDCDDVAPLDGDLSIHLGCPKCGRIGGLRPHIVWFGEEPLEMDRIFDLFAEADLFVSIGTSGVVYPAAGFVAAARQAGIPSVEINLEPSENAVLFTHARYGKASEAVPAWVDHMIRTLAND